MGVVVRFFMCVSEFKVIFVFSIVEGCFFLVVEVRRFVLDRILVVISFWIGENIFD